MAIAPKRTHTRAWIASLAVTACAATGFSLGVSGCNGGGDCLTNEEFFKQEVFPMVENNCMSCHNEQGVAKQYWPEALELIDAMPRTASGKIQKFVMREAMVKEMPASKARAG